MKTIRPLICLALLLLPAIAFAQNARLQLGSFAQLEAKAAEVVDVTIDERMLQLAAKFLSSRDPDQAKVKQLVAGLKGVYVKSYEFDQEGQYSTADLEALRAQLHAPGWSRMVGVTSRRKGGENVEVAVMTEGDRIVGLGIVSAEPKELTIVNIVGPIDLDKLSDLEGNFGIPRLGLSRKEKSAKQDK